MPNVAYDVEKSLRTPEECQVVMERALPPMQGTRVVPAHFGDESGMLGAALFALERGEG